MPVGTHIMPNHLIILASFHLNTAWKHLAEEDFPEEWPTVEDTEELVESAGCLLAGHKRPRPLAASNAHVAEMRIVVLWWAQSHPYEVCAPISTMCLLKLLNTVAQYTRRRADGLSTMYRG